jgi:hypothetical protein
MLSKETFQTFQNGKIIQNRLKMKDLVFTSFSENVKSEGKLNFDVIFLLDLLSHD